MLHRFLEIIKAGEMLNLSEIAGKMGISAGMVLQMAKDLTLKGYLEEIGANCATSQTGCSDCPAGGGCQPLTRSWMLTEKGRRALPSQ